MTRKIFPISKKRFGQYVAASHGASFRRGDSDRCPLTRAIQAVRPKAKDTNGSGPAVVSTYTIPPWALRFMALYDDGATAVAAARKVGAIK